MLLPIPWSTNVEILEVAHISCVLQNLRIKYNIYIYIYIFFKDLSHGLEPKKTCRFKGACMHCGMNHIQTSLSDPFLSNYLPAVLLTLLFFFYKGQCLLSVVCDTRLLSLSLTESCLVMEDGHAYWYMYPQRSQSYSMPQCWPSLLRSPSLHDGNVFVTYISVSHESSLHRNKNQQTITHFRAR